MAISSTVDVIATALWPQGDARDPLGIWGFRLGVTGDASGGSIKVTAQVPAERNAGLVYTIYSLLIAQLTGTFASVTSRARILTNWPNIDSIAGVQAYAANNVVQVSGDADFTSPLTGPFEGQFVRAHERFLLLFDPRPAAGVLSLIELEYGNNEDTATYSFEGYGYYWDRSVLQAPGGPRHPGSS